jgi:glutamyl-tRNA synthetase
MVAVKDRKPLQASLWAKTGRLPAASPQKKEESARPVRVRMAPSPTGPLHIGTARTALFNFLFARHEGGTFVLRIEDTDKERSKKEYEDGLIEGLQWLGLNWDEGPLLDGEEKGKFGPYRQSERFLIYKKYLQQLLDSGNAYYCYCTKEELEAQKQDMAAHGLPPKYNGHCRNLTAPPADKKPEVIRFKVPEVQVAFKDMIRGNVEFDTALFGDIVIAKDLDTPLYNFAVVVDDELMQITHVIRGEDHIANTPKQIMMQRALKFTEPQFAHLPLILNADRSKMSKRFADTALSDYRTKGYLPDALVNFLALLGWHPQDDQELFTRDELALKFDISRVQKSGAVFDQQKLDWLNREYIKRMDLDKLVELVIPFLEKEGIKITPPNLPSERGGTGTVSRDFVEKVVAAEQPRATTLCDFAEQGRFFFELPDYAPDMLVWKKAPMPFSEIAAVLEEIKNALLAEFTEENISTAIASVVRDRQKGHIFWPLRVSLSGHAVSPDPVEIMMVLGKEETVKRIDIAIKKLETK